MPLKRRCGRSGAVPSFQSCARLLPLLLSCVIRASCGQRVSQPKALQDAVATGAEHVLVVSHLDMRGLDTVPCGAAAVAPLLCVDAANYTTALSIRGNCLRAYDGSLTRVTLLAIRPPQCVLIASTSFMQVEGRAAWIHELHVILQHPTASGATVLVDVLSGSSVWATRIHLQGDGTATELSLLRVGMTSSSKILFADGLLSDAEDEKGAAVLCNNASCSLLNTTILCVESSSSTAQGAVFGLGTANMSCQSCIFDSTVLAAIGHSGSAKVYSDGAEGVWNQAENGSEPALLPAGAPSGLFLTLQDSKLLEIQVAAEEQLGVQTDSTGTISAPSGSVAAAGATVSATLSAGVLAVVAVVAVIALCAEPPKGSKAEASDAIDDGRGHRPVPLGNTQFSQPLSYHAPPPADVAIHDRSRLASAPASAMWSAPAHDHGPFARVPTFGSQGIPQYSGGSHGAALYSGGGQGIPSYSGGSQGAPLYTAGSQGIPQYSGGSHGAPLYSGGGQGIPSHSGGSYGAPLYTGGGQGIPSYTGGSHVSSSSHPHYGDTVSSANDTTGPGPGHGPPPAPPPMHAPPRYSTSEARDRAVQGWGPPYDPPQMPSQNQPPSRYTLTSHGDTVSSWESSQVHKPEAYERPQVPQTQTRYTLPVATASTGASTEGGGASYSQGPAPPMMAASGVTAIPEPADVTDLRFTRLPKGAADGPPEPVTPTDSPRQRVASVLDRIYKHDILIFGRFRILSLDPRQRREGGQAVVQFVESRAHEPLAAKFFIRPIDFKNERELYEIEALRAAMPEVVFVHEGGWRPEKWPDQMALQLPACLVMHRGESLREFVKAAGHNLFQTVHALGQVVTKLKELHEQQWVHRDLKPDNLLWNPTKRTWSLLDFGCAARIGTKARLAYSLTYAAPEVMQADEKREHEMVITPEIDMWSLGVIAFEMLTEQPVFPPMTLKNDAVNAILGRGKGMPWEDASVRQPLLKKLGMFKRSVLACLERDPRKRISCKTLLEMWEDQFAAQTAATLQRD